MATITATCTGCGDVRLIPSEITARVCLDDDQLEYRFRCPSCQTIVAKQTSDRVVDLLMSAGATMETWTRPAEALVVQQPTDIDDDEISDFRTLMDDEDAFTAAIMAISAS